MKILFLSFATLVSALGFSQDPSCTYVIYLENANLSKYEYRFFTQTNFNYMPIDSIGAYGIKGLTISDEHVESGISKSGNKLLISTYKTDYCYPNEALENQLRIIVLRKRKSDSKLDIMYTDTKLEAEKKVIVEIKKFKSGRRKFDYYQYIERYHDSEGVDYGLEQRKELVATKIYIY